MREIRTLAELKALPTQSVIVDADEDAWQLLHIELDDGTLSDWWKCTTDGVSCDADGLFGDYSPLLLVWTPADGAS